MHRRVPYDDQEEEPDSPSSWEDTKIARQSSKKNRRNVEKRVISVPIADVDGSKSRGDVYPPSDSWAWRKYGQKPIKGSPYPRGYYRCSSSKGCPARKQVERSRADPTKLLITYASDHNHPLPTAKPHHQLHQNDTVSEKHKREAEAAADTGASSADTAPAGLDLSHVDLPMCHPDEFHWFDDVALFDTQICTDADVTLEGPFSIREEDESLFGDLGDLPDGTVVFHRSAAVHGDRQRPPCFGAVECYDGSQ